MQTHTDIVATTRQIRAALAHHPHLGQALIFGSVASGRARPDSDLDIAVAADQALGSAKKRDSSSRSPSPPVARWT